MDINEFREKYNTIYCWLYRNNPKLLEKVFKFKIKKRVPRGYWTKKKCIESAKKFKSIKDWQKNSTAYNSAIKNGWIKECCAHMDLKIYPKNYWTKKRCIESAKKFKSIKDWSKKDSKAYDASKRNGWYKDCISNLVNLKHKAKKVVNLDTTSMYKNADVAGNVTGINSSNIRSACNGNAKTAGGYRWAYCDEDGNILDNKGRKK